jgi:hypothetical protein
VFHTAAKISKKDGMGGGPSGKIKVFSFTLAKYNAEQDGGGQPATRSESKFSHERVSPGKQELLLARLPHLALNPDRRAEALRFVLSGFQPGFSR